jgi:hypothetical protein
VTNEQRIRCVFFAVASARAHIVADVGSLARSRARANARRSDVHADLLRALPSRSAGADPSAAAERLEAARQQISALSDQVEEEVAALAQARASCCV